jgi:cell division protein FtsW
MFFVSGASLLHLGVGLAFLFGLFLLLIRSAPYRMQRFLVFLNPADEKLGAGYHINQALLAIGSGGLWGLGFGQSKQKYLYLPEPHTDSVFAIATEELGFLRASLVFVVFIIIALRGFKIAKNAPDLFSTFLAVGITTWILIQFFINIGAMVGLLPLTGIPLPFVSYGGSSLIVLLFSVGILLNISKQVKT